LPGKLDEPRLGRSLALPISSLSLFSFVQLFIPDEKLTTET